MGVCMSARIFLMKVPEFIKKLYPSEIDAFEKLCLQDVSNIEHDSSTPNSEKEVYMDCYEIDRYGNRLEDSENG